MMTRYIGLDMYEQRLYVTTDSKIGHSILGRVINEYNSKKSSCDSECPYSVCEETSPIYGICDEDENMSESYVITNYSKEYYAVCIRMESGKYMIMPYGYISKNVNIENLKGLINIESINSDGHIKKDMILESLEDVAYVITGQRESKLCKKQIN